MATELAAGEKLISRKEAATYLQQRGATVSYNTLGVWASADKGPPFYKDGHRALYNVVELDLWWRTRRLRRVEA